MEKEAKTDEAVPKQKHGYKPAPTRHPVALAFMVVCIVAFIVALYMMFSGSLSIGDGVFGLLVSGLCGCSAAGHAFADDGGDAPGAL